MRKINYFILFANLFIIVFGCNNSDHSINFGSPISNHKSIAIADLFDDATAYIGKTVTIQGVVDSQDQRGYWFYVQDEEARIYVEINSADFSIPDLTNKKILVEGVVEVQLDIPSLMATGSVLPFSGYFVRQCIW
jgi:uncharacterized protein YdeI (BOF family)